VLIVIDTLRADRLGCYGYERPTTPNLDALARRGIRFANVSSTSSWTVPAHASLFTGLYPIRHGATQERPFLDAGPATLAEILRSHGYATAAASANPQVGPLRGLERGFDSFAETWRPARGILREHPNHSAVKRFLDSLEPDRPFFLFVNYMEPHAPYAPLEPFRSRFRTAPEAGPPLEDRLRVADHYLGSGRTGARELAALSDLYDGAVAAADALVGQLVALLEAEGRLADTLLVIASDHGENLGDHGHVRHVFNLYASVVRVPLIVVLPGDVRAGEVRPEAASLVDVFATILARVGVSPPDPQAGRDLLAGTGETAGRAVFAEYYHPDQALELFGPDVLETHGEKLAPYLRRLRSVEWDGLRLIWSSKGDPKLYDLDKDRGELRDLAGDRGYAVRKARLLAALDAFVAAAGGEPERAATGSAGRTAIEPDTATRLRELGYLRR